jgi:hypothetical protein
MVLKSIWQAIKRCVDYAKACDEFNKMMEDKVRERNCTKCKYYEDKDNCNPPEHPLPSHFHKPWNPEIACEHWQPKEKQMKIGDRVKLIKHGCTLGFNIGDICTITGMYCPGERPIKIENTIRKGYVFKDEIELIEEKQMKIGARVRLKSGGNISGSNHIETIRDIENDRVWTEESPGWSYIESLELVEEKQMKDTITLRELIEQDACKEDVLWFMDYVMNHIGWSNDSDSLKDCCKNVNIGYVIEKANRDNKLDYITWLHDHGYQTKDNQEALDEISKLKQRISELEDSLK